MSFALDFDFDIAMFDTETRLKKVLKDNSGRYTISKNGYIELDLSNDNVKKSIEKKIEEIGSIEEEKQADK